MWKYIRFLLLRFFLGEEKLCMKCGGVLRKGKVKCGMEGYLYCKKCGNMWIKEFKEKEGEEDGRKS